ncbi:hypothetical protein HDV00_008726 [Rhizophlyctis rosea]|nr:hypothetical protein HDV00_008726 [Rhizophlyctis rosea]
MANSAQPVPESTPLLESAPVVVATEAIHLASASPSPAATVIPGPVPLLGIRYSYLEVFIERCGGKAALTGLTTAEVCKKFIEPFTEQSQSFCDHLADESQTYVTQANWFISHTWQYNFLEVVDSIIAFFHIPNSMKLTDVVLWIDVFSLPQHERRKIDSQWLKTAFTEAISAMGNVLMVLSPWDGPIALTRAWCVFVLYACVSTKSAFHVSMTPEQQGPFERALINEEGAWKRTTAVIRCESSDASDQDDRIAIHTAILDTIGFEALDEMVRDVLFDHMVGMAQFMVYTAGRLGRFDEYEDGLEHLARLYRARGMVAEERQSLHRAYLNSSTINGHYDKKTLELLGRGVSGWEMDGAHEFAARLTSDHLEEWEKALGKEHPQILQWTHSVAAEYIGQGAYVTAETLLVDCVRRAERVLGEDNSTTYAFSSTLACCLGKMGKTGEAEPMYLKCIEGLTRLCGEDHEDTLVAVAGLASLYMEGKQFDKAEPWCLRRFEGQRRKGGDDDPATLDAVGNLAFLYVEQGRLELAQTTLQDAIDHNQQVSSVNEGHRPQLCVMLQSIQRLVEAETRQIKILEERGRHMEYDVAEKERKLGDKLRQVSELNEIYDSLVSLKEHRASDWDAFSMAVENKEFRMEHELRQTAEIIGLYNIFGSLVKQDVPDFHAIALLKERLANMNTARAQSQKHGASAVNDQPALESSSQDAKEDPSELKHQAAQEGRATPSNSSVPAHIELPTAQDSTPIISDISKAATIPDFPSNSTQASYPAYWGPPGIVLTNPPREQQKTVRAKCKAMPRCCIVL